MEVKLKFRLKRGEPKKKKKFLLIVLLKVVHCFNKQYIKLSDLPSSNETKTVFISLFNGEGQKVRVNSIFK